VLNYNFSEFLRRAKYPTGYQIKIWRGDWG